MENITSHIVCFSGGESSAIVAVELVRKFGKENVILVNHNINSKKEVQDIKRFKNEVANYLGLEITYVNIDGIKDENLIPNQFEVCLKAGAMTSFNGHALCTAKLKTEPFYKWLEINYQRGDNLFAKQKQCIIYYGFDIKEFARMQRRSSLLGAMGYKTDYPCLWKDRTIHKISEIGIIRPATYEVFEHANCIGCLKAGLLHWYVVYHTDIETYMEAVNLEDEINYTVHTVVRDKIKMPIRLTELAPFYEKMKLDGIPITEHQNKIKFGHLIKKYQIQEVEANKPCECTD
tara:strand:- start:393 stop:1262 length:870 start_codon:yes stop_codon:yes gene_type:complete